MITTKKHIEQIRNDITACYFCGERIRLEEIDGIDYVTNADKETVYFHHSCFLRGQRAALEGMKEGKRA